MAKAHDNTEFCISPGYEALLRENHLDSLDALFATFTPSDSCTLSKPGLATWRERIRLTLDGNGKQFVVYLKRYAHPPKTVRPARLADPQCARSHAGLEWARAHELRKLGVACAEPIAFGAQFDRNKEQRSAIVLAAVPGRSLETWAREWVQTGRRPDRALLNDVADLIGRLHRVGLVHRDLYLSHIFWDPRLSRKRWLHLIDLQRVFRPSVFHERWRIKDLAALHYSTPELIVTRTDRFRWLKRYLQASTHEGHAKALAYRIIGKAARIAEHDRRRRSRVQG